jgi:glycosyltransferase involved in cell wall biosynthesis
MGTRPESNSAEMPDVSVVIPTRDRWHVLLTRGLPAALNQVGVLVEVIVVDDGSSTPPPVEARDDPRVRVISRQGSDGVGAARNRGIREAQAAWVAFLDDDDVWAPTKLAATITAVRAAEADFGFSSALVVDDQLRPIWLIPAPDPEDLAPRLLRDNVIPGGASNIVAKRSIIERSGGFDETFSALADWDLWLRLADAGTAGATSEPLLAFRRASWVLRDSRAHSEEPVRFVEKHRDLARRHGASFSWVGYEQWMGRTLFLAGRRRAAARSFLATGLRHRDPRSMAWAGRALLPSNLRRTLGLGPGAVREPPAWLRSYGHLAR